MADIRKLLETKRNGLRVNLFEFDIDDEENFNHIKTYLINKVKKSKIHNIEEYDLTYYGAKNLNPAFGAKFNVQAAKINIPKKHQSVSSMCAENVLPNGWRSICWSRCMDAPFMKKPIKE